MTAFVSSVLLADPAPDYLTENDAAANIAAWTAEQVEMPAGMVAAHLVREWNRQIDIQRLNSMCLACSRLHADCDGETDRKYTGCIWRE